MKRCEFKREWRKSIGYKELVGLRQFGGLWKFVEKSKLVSSDKADREKRCLTYNVWRYMLNV